METTITIRGKTYPLCHDYKRYPMVIVDGKPYRVHRLVWEMTYGTLPPGIDLHHKDFNKQNWAIDNLQPMTHGEHSRLHASMRRNAKEGSAKNDEA